MTRAARNVVAGQPSTGTREDIRIRLMTAIVMVCLVLLVYAAVVGIGNLFGRSGPPGLLPSIVATAVVALLFEPVRQRTGRMIARLTHHHPVTSPQDVLAHFSDTVAGRYPARERSLPDRIAKTLAEGTGARRAEVWLVVRGRLELAAGWPERTEQPEPATPAVESAKLPQPDEIVGQRSVEVRDRGELLGVLTVFPESGRDLTPVEWRLFSGLAAQAGLVLRVSGLRIELEQRLTELEQRTAELRRSRRELVSRQDRERQRLERNIHDGAQQEVIALLVNLRLAQTLLGRAPDRAKELLIRQAEATRATIRTLEDLSRGLYPLALTADGPVAALRVAAERSPIPVIITALAVPRTLPTVEAALYFGCLEALQNAVKHSSAARIDVHIRVVGQVPTESIEVNVVDDGFGFELSSAAASSGRGLDNLRDRVESVGGMVRMQSEPGRGAQIRFLLPLTKGG